MEIKEKMISKPFTFDESELVLKTWIHDSGRVLIAEETNGMPYTRLSLFSDNSNTLLPLEFLGRDYTGNEFVFDYLIRHKYVISTGNIVDNFNVYRVNIDLFDTN